MSTGKKAASAAGHVLSDPKATKAERSVAASDLAQRRSTSSSRSSGARKSGGRGSGRR